MQAPGGIPRLCHGDRLPRDEFERRYAAMPDCKKAELIEGVVHMPSPVSTRHGRPHFLLSRWLGHYEGATPGVRAYDNTTLRLDLDNEPQPDLLLRLLPEHGGACRDTEDHFLQGPPELVLEVTASSVSYDLHSKLHAYRRNGVREYLAWRVDDHAIDWFVLRGGRYELLAPPEAPVMRSEAFPGLWLDPLALLRDDMPAVLRKLDQGLASPEHAAFVARIGA